MPSPPSGRQFPGRPAAPDPRELGTNLLMGGREWLRDKTAPIAAAVQRGLDPGDYLSGRMSNAVLPPAKRGKVKIDTGNTTVVVVGGGADGYLGSDQTAAHDYADKFSNRKFFTHLEAKFLREPVLRSIEERAHGGPIILIGHSWGGPQAYELARDLKARGNSVIGLFTADPVSRISSGTRPNTFWVNVAAASQARDATDHVASVGGKPSALPVQSADVDAVASGHHVDLDKIMQQPLNNGISAEDQIKALVRAASKAAPID